MNILKSNTRKLIIAIFLFIILFGSVVLYSTHNKKRELLPFFNQFVVAADVPYLIENGKVLKCQTDGQWEDGDFVDNAIQIFGGDALCILDSNGKLHFDERIITGDIPLSTAYSMYMTNKALEINQNKSFTSINQNVGCFAFRALLEDGTILYQKQNNYAEYKMEKDIPKYLSGDYILTEEGNVYYMKTETLDDNDVFEMKCVYDKGDLIAIDAAETTDKCIGIRENGKVILWSGTEIEHVLNWKNVVRVEQGFNFAIGLTARGEVKYEGYDENNTKTINDELSLLPDMKDIAIYYGQIWGLTEDNRVIKLLE